MSVATSANTPTNAPRGFHVETTWKRPFPRCSTWNPRGVFVGNHSKTIQMRKLLNVSNLKFFETSDVDHLNFSP